MLNTLAWSCKSKIYVSLSFFAVFEVIQRSDQVPGRVFLLGRGERCEQEKESLQGHPTLRLHQSGFVRVPWRHRLRLHQRQFHQRGLGIQRLHCMPGTTTPHRYISIHILSFSYKYWQIEFHWQSGNPVR